MFNLIGDAIVKFMTEKKQPFPSAMLSQRHFNSVAVWKKAEVYVKLLRSVLNVHANAHWYNYGYVNYKFSKNVFDAYCAKHEEIWKVCKVYQNMPEDFIRSDRKRKDMYNTPTKKRTRTGFELSTPENVTISPKLICLVSDDSSEESEDGEAR